MTMKPLDQFTSLDIRQHGEALRSATAPEMDSFDGLVQRARQHRMTAEEVRAQRISFVYGQLMDCAPQVTREQVAAQLDEVYGMGEPPRPLAPLPPIRPESEGPGLWPFLAPLAILGAAAALVWAASTLPAPAQQMHDMSDPGHWYPMACCNLRDCFEVAPELMQPTAEGWRYAPTGEVIPFARVRQTPPEAGATFHVCTYAGDPTAGIIGRTLTEGHCVWAPQMGS